MIANTNITAPVQTTFNHINIAMPARDDNSAPDTRVFGFYKQRLSGGYKASKSLNRRLGQRCGLYVFQRALEAAGIQPGGLSQLARRVPGDIGRAVAVIDETAVRPRDQSERRQRSNCGFVQRVKLDGRLVPQPLVSGHLQPDRSVQSGSILPQRIDHAAKLPRPVTLRPGPLNRRAIVAQLGRANVVPPP